MRMKTLCLSLWVALLLAATTVFYALIHAVKQ